MNESRDGRAIVYCEGAFGTPNGKTAHGLVRRTRRYQVLSVVDSRHAGADAGRLLDGRPNGIPVVLDTASAIDSAGAHGLPATHFVIGLAPDGGRLDASHRGAVRTALERGLNVDSGLHDLLADDLEFAALARRSSVRIRDVRRTPPRDQLHFFTGKIEQVTSLKVAVLGTDSAVGKRTTAWALVDALEAREVSAELVGTGQTAWMQGARYVIILDSLINDFIAGELEHAVWSAWSERRPAVIVIEGQGSLMNPAYPGGYEILAAGRPDVLVMQHAPARREYDGFPGYALHPLERQIEAVELISGKPVVAVTVNHEGLTLDETRSACSEITRRTGLPACDVLTEGAETVTQALLPHLGRSRRDREARP